MMWLAEWKKLFLVRKGLLALAVCLLLKACFWGCSPS